MHHTYGDSLLTLSEHVISDSIEHGILGQTTPTLQERDRLRHDLTHHLRVTINTWLQTKGGQ